MDEADLTTEQRVALAWLYAAAAHAPSPRVFTFRHVGGAIWARHATATDGSEYRLPGEALQRFAASGFLTLARDDRFELHSDWEGWAHVRHAFSAPHPLV